MLNHLFVTNTVPVGVSKPFALSEEAIQILQNQGLSASEIDSLERHDPRFVAAIIKCRCTPLTEEYTTLAEMQRGIPAHINRLEDLIEYFCTALEGYTYTSVTNSGNTNWVADQAKAEEVIYAALIAGYDYQTFYQTHMAGEGVPEGTAQREFEDISEFYKQHEIAITEYRNCSRRMDEILGELKVEQLCWDNGAQHYHIYDGVSLYTYYPNFVRYKINQHPACCREYDKWYIVNCPEIVSYFMNNGNIIGMNKYLELLAKLSELFADCGYNALDEANKLIEAFCNDEKCFCKEEPVDK